MKLVRFGNAGEEKPGIIDVNGDIRDLSSVVSDINGDSLSPDSLKKISQLNPLELPSVGRDVRVGACVGPFQNFVAVGLNFVDHAKESGADIPAEPVLFNKSPNCVVGPYDDVIIPKGSKKTDWEVELAIVIGSPAYNVAESDVFDVIAGFALCLDVSERTSQLEGTGQWMKGKCYPTFGPLGPYLVTPDEIADIHKLAMTLDVNGERMQSGNTDAMIFNVPVVVSYISKFMCLQPGDVITTGTPAGVGGGMKPPRFLKAGDKVDLAVDQLGSQSHSMVAFDV